MIFNKTNINLAEITIEILERFASRASAKAQTFKLELTPEDGDFEIYTNRSHSVTILLNLLENIIKHGEINSIVIMTT